MNGCYEDVPSSWNSYTTPWAQPGRVCHVAEPMQVSARLHIDPIGIDRQLASLWLPCCSLLCKCAIAVFALCSCHLSSVCICVSSYKDVSSIGLEPAIMTTS